MSMHFYFYSNLPAVIADGKLVLKNYYYYFRYS